MTTMRRRRTHRRRTHLTPIEQTELVACIFLAAVIIGIVGGPLAYYLVHACT